MMMLNCLLLSEHSSDNVLKRRKHAASTLFSVAKRVSVLSGVVCNPEHWRRCFFLNQNKSLWNLALTALIVNEKDSETADDNENNEEEYEEDW